MDSGKSWSLTQKGWKEGHPQQILCCWVGEIRMYFGISNFQDISLNNKDGTRGHAWVWWSLFFLSTACAVLQLLWQAGWPAVPPTMLRHFFLDDVFDKRRGFGDRNISATWTNPRTTTSCEICLALRFGSTAGTSNWTNQLSCPRVFFELMIWCLHCCCWLVFSKP